MKKWNVIIDVAECTNCNLCTLATQDEYVGNDWPGVAAPMPRHGHRWIDIRRKERGQPPQVDVAYMPTMCQHCDDAPCIQAATGGAVVKRDDGIVIIDPVKAKGQKAIRDACPHGAVFWNEELDIPQAWPFDAHLLDAGWPEPRAATACPTGAFRALKVEDSEMARLRREEELEYLDPSAGTRPRVHYKNLHRFTKCFIAGQVAGDRDGTEECIEGARVSLGRDGIVIAETRTDAFGDFRIDRLEPDAGPYSLTVTHDAFREHRMELESDPEGGIDLGESITLPLVRLQPA